MDFDESLNAAGISFLGDCSGWDRLIPPVVAGQAPSCPIEERWTEMNSDTNDPEILHTMNQGWYRQSIDSGLFADGDRRFLLAQSLGDDGPSRWIRVRLQGQWDILGDGASGALGSGWCRPEFRMLSLDGSVLCCGTTGESAVSIFVIKEPSRSITLRRFAEWIVTTDIYHPADAAAVNRWLALSGRGSS
ncbi:hypothetical protein JCM9533A_35130 [Catenuloplanes niger JCM 9533]